MRRLFLLLAASFLIAMPVCAVEVPEPGQAGQRTGQGDGQASEEAWNPEEDPAADAAGSYPEAGTDTLSVTVKYTDGLKAEAGDTFDIVYQVVGSDAPATITVDADEIDGYEGEIELPEGTYEVLGLQYTGEREEIQSYGIENGFTVGNNAAICLVIGKDGTFSLAGQEGYFTQIGEEDMSGEAPTDAELREAEIAAEQKEEPPEIENPGILRAVPLLVLSVVLAAGVCIVKKKGLLDR